MAVGEITGGENVLRGLVWDVRCSGFLKFFLSWKAAFCVPFWKFAYTRPESDWPYQCVFKAAVDVSLPALLQLMLWHVMCHYTPSSPVYPQPCQDYLPVFLQSGYQGAEEPLLARAEPGKIPQDSTVELLKGACRFGMCLFASCVLLDVEIEALDPDVLLGLSRCDAKPKFHV